MTSVGTEVDPRSAGMTRDGVERIWDSVVRAYSSGAFPAISLCVRREVGFRWTSYGVRAEDLDQVATNYPDPRGSGRFVKRLEHRAVGGGAAELVTLSNDPRFLTLVAPAGNRA